MSYRSQLVLVLVALLFAGTAVAAPFVDNNATPPTGNTDEPINRGTTTQVKDGTLYTGGFGILNNSLLRLPISPATPGGSNIAGQVLTLVDAANGDARWLPATGGSGGNFWEAATGGIKYLGGKVGIGTDTPSGKLDVKGNVLVGDTTSLLNFGPGGNGANYIQTGLTNTSGSKADLFVTDFSNTTQFLSVKANSGNVGVGIGNPAQKLDVNGNIWARGAYFKLGQSGGDALHDGGEGTLHFNPSGQFDRLVFNSNFAKPMTFKGTATFDSICLSGVCRTDWPSGGGAATAVNAGTGITVTGTNPVTVTNSGVTSIRGSAALNGSPAVSVNSQTGDVIVSVGSQFPAGTKLIFMTPCPAGWTRDGAQDARFLIVSDSGHSVGTQSWTPRTGSDYSKTSDSEGPWLLNTVVVNSPLPPSASPAHSHPVPSVSINICTKN